MSHRSAEFLASLQSLGKAITPDMINGTIGLYAPLHSLTPAADVKITRDLRYGDADRHRLDIYAPQQAGEKRPVLVFVHGGGFVGGDKQTPNSPFYENVGRWAVRNEFLGVALTYRLAPAHRWPCGSDDVAGAVAYLRKHVGEYGGDADKIFLMGQSAGAVHVAGYLAREQSPSKDGWRPAGAILVSGLYDTQTMDRNPLFNAYFSDPGVASEKPFLDALARTDVPLLSVVAELDPVDFIRQFNKLNEAYLAHHQRLPRIVQMQGHNHLSTVMHINTDDESLAIPLFDFMRSA